MVEQQLHYGLIMDHPGYVQAFFLFLKMRLAPGCWSYLCTLLHLLPLLCNVSEAEPEAILSPCGEIYTSIHL